MYSCYNELNEFIIIFQIDFDDELYECAGPRTRNNGPRE